MKVTMVRRMLVSGYFVHGIDYAIFLNRFILLRFFNRLRSIIQTVFSAFPGSFILSGVRDRKNPDKDERAKFFHPRELPDIDPTIRCVSESSKNVIQKVYQRLLSF